jgi:hypothetical protein
MVSYSITDDKRFRINFTLAALSIALATLLRHQLESLLPNITAPSAFLIFGIFNTFVFSLCWKWPGINKYVATPNLNGDWEGVVESKDFIERQVLESFPVKATITQNLNKIEIATYRDEPKDKKTRSRILALNIDNTNPGCCYLKYAYELRILSDGRLHEGFGEFEYKKDKDELEGNYCSNKGRQGRILLNRCKSIQANRSS